MVTNKKVNQIYKLTILKINLLSFKFTFTAFDTSIISSHIIAELSTAISKFC